MREVNLRLRRPLGPDADGELSDQEGHRVQFKTVKASSLSEFLVAQPQCNFLGDSGESTHYGHCLLAGIQVISVINGVPSMFTLGSTLKCSTGGAIFGCQVRPKGSILQLIVSTYQNAILAGGRGA